MDISVETSEHTEARLLRVLSQAEWHVLQGNYVFTEFPLDQFLQSADPQALALVRDDEVWSQLAPSVDSSLELFTLFRFHFPPGVDNSGFVGWLATHLKRELGTGVFVICGQNTSHGGIFDYWGVPAVLSDDVRAVVAAMRASPSQDRQ